LSDHLETPEQYRTRMLACREAAFLQLLTSRYGSSATFVRCFNSAFHYSSQRRPEAAKREAFDLFIRFQARPHNPLLQFNMQWMLLRLRADDLV
jgi:hypothetical protein